MELPLSPSFTVRRRSGIFTAAPNSFVHSAPFPLGLGIAPFFELAKKIAYEHRGPDRLVKGTLFIVCSKAIHLRFVRFAIVNHRAIGGE